MKKLSFFTIRSVATVLAFAGLLTPSVAVAQTATRGATSTGSTLIVTFDKFRSNKGILRVLLFQQAKGYPDDAARAYKTRDVLLSQFMKGDAKEATITFADLPPGTYALAAHHDENGNSKFDTHWYGKPREGVAASNNPRPKMRAVRFNEAKFEMGNVGKAIPMSVWYP